MELGGGTGTHGEAVRLGHTEGTHGEAVRLPAEVDRRARARPSHGRAARRARCAAAALAAAGVSTGLATTAGTAAGATAPAVTISQAWQVLLNDAGGPVALSSPTVANLDGQPAVVVGDRAGYVWALHLADGSSVPGWPYYEGAPVDSTPSVAAINAFGLDSVFVGSGNTNAPTVGGYQAISPGGGDQWFVPARNPATDPYPQSGVQAGLAVGSLQGTTAVVAGNLGQMTYAIGAAGGNVLAGFPWFQADSNFTTPALADLYGNGQQEIVEGGDSTAGIAYGVTYQNGGHLRVLTGSGGLVCDNNGFTQTIQSSPAVGEFLGGATVGIVFGTGATYGGSANTDQVIATDAHCNVRWATTLDGSTATSSPALADVVGNGALQVVEGTDNGSGGSVWVLDGATGAPIWHAAASGRVIGSVVTADLTGQGYQDLIVPTTAGVEIFDGKSGAVVATLGQFQAFQNAPLVTDDPGGAIGITTAGYEVNRQGQLQSVVTHYVVAGSNGSLVDERGAWPMFHHDPQLTGDAGTPPPVVVVPCSPPPPPPDGYVMAAADGGVFNFGNLPFCGSLGNLVLDAPVVAAAESHDGGGYWLAAADGGVFAFDDAGYYGSMGGRPLNQPIVGMATTADGRGYWLVARDGGIFAFGDAGYYGSMGGRPLNQPIVGMAATADGGGYWLVARDGGIFAFGDASFDGSMGGRPLDAPIVAMAADRATGGYWEVAADGGVFAFDAPFLGSMGGQPLNAPIIGMAAADDGSGYRFVATDGGVFSYGLPFLGSMGGRPLNAPIVAFAAT
ncbi:MAG TPA: hypothetical protein VKV36_04715 [Acidimicrobiales bacterium]|nr:hypothetical protein [Acidimicrobiales bacterium]